MKTAVVFDGHTHYGMALWNQRRNCGVTVWGHGGKLPGFRTVSVHSADGTRQLTVSYVPGTPKGIGEADALESMIDTVFCGKAGPS